MLLIKTSFHNLRIFEMQFTKSQVHHTRIIAFHLYIHIYQERFPT